MKILNRIKESIRTDLDTVKELNGVSSDKKTRIYLKWTAIIVIIILIMVFLVSCAGGCNGSKNNNNEQTTTSGYEKETPKETESETMPSTEGTTEEETLPDDTANSGSTSNSGSNSGNHLKPPKPVEVPADKDPNVLPSNKYPENGTSDEEDRPKPTEAPQETPGENPTIIVKPTVPEKETETEKTTIEDDMDNPYGDDKEFPTESETEKETEKETETEPPTQSVRVQFRRVDGAGIINVSIMPSGLGRNVVGFWVYPDGSIRAASSTTNGYRIIYKFGIDYSAVKLIVRVDGKEFSYNL